MVAYKERRGSEKCASDPRVAHSKLFFFFAARLYIYIYLPRPSAGPRAVNERLVLLCLQGSNPIEGSK